MKNNEFTRKETPCPLSSTEFCDREVITNIAYSIIALREMEKSLKKGMLF